MKKIVLLLLFVFGLAFGSNFAVHDTGGPFGGKSDISQPIDLKAQMSFDGIECNPHLVADADIIGKNYDGVIRNDNGNRLTSVLKHAIESDSLKSFEVGWGKTSYRL